MEETMTLNDALKILHIEDYEQRIFNSNSHGELFHLQQYISLATFFKDDKQFTDTFRDWFERVVKRAEKEWKRPESVFQHIETMLLESENKNPV